MTASTPSVEDFVLPPEPSAARSLWASLVAVITKESRWRMRGRRAFVLVTIYLSLLALLVFALYRLMYDGAVNQAEFQGGMPGSFVAGQVSARIGQAVFSAILVIQTTLTMILAPALTSGAISTEREKQTLELLITTPVSTLGMVVGKLFASLAFVLLLIVASVPLMSIVFAFGGIAPEDVVRAYVLLFAIAFGIGAIGLFMSALVKRSQAATAISYLIVLGMTLGTLILYGFMAASSQRVVNGEFQRARPPEALLWLNPIVADMDLGCTAVPDSYAVTCSFIVDVTGSEALVDRVAPPRDLFWPRSAVAFIVLGLALTLATTQLIAPSRRWHRSRRTPTAQADEDGADAEDAVDTESAVIQ